MEGVPDAKHTADVNNKSKPSTIDEYKVWMKSTLGHEYDLKDQHRYDSNLKSALDSISQHTFIMELEKELQLWLSEYKRDRSSDLFMIPPILNLAPKPYKSSIDKCFRTNVIWNEKYPNAPKMGWVTPVNVYSILNDLIRTRFVCKFIDGPRFVTEKLGEYFKAKGQQCEVYSQENDRGYYAHHFHTWFDVEIMDSKWDASIEKIQLEIQVTTQLQDILDSLTHPYYEISRINPEPRDDNQWKWDTKSNRFRSAYMGHTLHLLEAIILDIRDKPDNSPKK